MVLVDACHPDQNQRAAKLLPPPTAHDDPGLVGLRRMLTMPYVEDPTNNPEGIDVRACDALAREARLLGDIPLVVLTAGRHVGPAHLPSDFLTRYDRMAQELQRALARLSTQSMHVIAAKSGHFIQHDEPDVEIDAIRQVVALARGR